MIYLSKDLELLTDVPACFAPVFTRRGTRGASPPAPPPPGVPQFEQPAVTYYRLDAALWAWVLRMVPRADAAAEAGSYDLDEWRAMRTRFAAARAVADVVLDPAAVQAALAVGAPSPQPPEYTAIPLPVTSASPVEDAAWDRWAAGGGLKLAAARLADPAWPYLLPDPAMAKMETDTDE